MCTNSLIDYANVPIIKESKLDYSRFYFKRVLANAPWRIMLPQYEYRRIARMKDSNKILRNNSYEQLFNDIFGKRSLTFEYTFLFLLYLKLNFPGSTLVFGTTNHRHMKNVVANYNRKHRNLDIDKISQLENRSRQVFEKYQYKSRV